MLHILWVSIAAICCCSLQLKEVVGVEPYDATLHSSLQLRGAHGGPLSAPASSWSCVFEPPETFLQETELDDGAGLVLLHRSACQCSRQEESQGQDDGEVWDETHTKAAALLQSATSAGGPLPLGAGRGAVTAAVGTAGGPPAVRPQSVVDVWFAAGGLVGLVNLANTCFLNAAVQCLSAVLPFSRYFLSGAYRADINEQNCMGTQGRLANAYAKTLKVSSTQG